MRDDTGRPVELEPEPEPPKNRAQRRGHGLGHKAQLPPWMREMGGSGRRHNKKARRG